jgi:hypothetical protein
MINYKIFRFDIEKQKWKILKFQLPNANSGFLFTQIEDEKIVIFGGIKNYTSLTTVYELDLQTHNYQNYNFQLNIDKFLLNQILFDKDDNQFTVI